MGEEEIGKEWGKVGPLGVMVMVVVVAYKWWLGSLL